MSPTQCLVASGRQRGHGGSVANVVMDYCT